MITIKRIEIDGFLGYRNFVWDLDPMVNILGGKNGSGKSSIFKLCYALLSTESLDNALDEHFSSLFEKVVLTFSNDWTLTWTRIKDSERIGSPLPLTFREQKVIIDNNWDKRPFSDLSSQLSVYLINSFEQHLGKAVEYVKQPTSLPLNDPTMLDLLIKDQIDLRNSTFSKVMENLVDSPDGVEYVKAYKRIYSSLSHFLQGYKEPFNSSFEFAKNNHSFGYEHLSMGEKQILLLLLMVSNTNQEPCIFFMDEPDLSMHIDWKENLVKELHELNPNMQIILSTHAPSVITGWHDKVKEVSQLIK